MAGALVHEHSRFPHPDCGGCGGNRLDPARFLEEKSKPAGTFVHNCKHALKRNHESSTFKAPTTRDDASRGMQVWEIEPHHAPTHCMGTSPLLLDRNPLAKGQLRL